MGDDGHTEIWLLQEGTDVHRLPLSLRWFSDGPRVVFAHPKYAPAVGGRVQAIGGRSPRDALDHVARFLSGDNRMEALYTGPVYLRTPEILEAAGLAEGVTGATVKVETPAGDTVRLELGALDPDTLSTASWIRARPADVRAMYERCSRDPYWFRHLKDSNTLYLQVNRSRDAPEGEDLAAFTERFLAEADRIAPDRLVVDLRHNVGGDFHLTEALAEGIGRRPALSDRDKLYVVLSKQTFSAGVMFAIQLFRAAEPVLVGEVARGYPNGSYDAGVRTLPRSGLESC